MSPPLRDTKHFAQIRFNSQVFRDIKAGATLQSQTTEHQMPDLLAALKVLSLTL